MPLVDDLLVQASELVTTDTAGRPKQANLRRAVSAAYYAVFHEASNHAVALIFGAAHADSNAARRVRRTISHSALLSASKWFVFGSDRRSRGETIDDMRDGGGGAAVNPAALSSFCDAVGDLQQARYEADYDLSVKLDRAEAKRLIALASQAVNDLRTCRLLGDTKVLLLGCLFDARLKKNVQERS